MADYCFIVNPVAGAGHAREAFAQAEALLRERGVQYAVLYSEYPGHASERVREALAAGHGCIVAVGGDGTALEVARVLLHTGVPMGILPCGTGNDLCKALHIPVGDIPTALTRLLSLPPRPVDAALANGMPYCNVAGLGWDVDILLNTERYKARHSGMAAYLMGVLRSLVCMRLREIRVESAERSVTARGLLVAAANGTHFGGGMHVAPLADPSDGLLDVCLIRDVGLLTALVVLPKFVKGKHLSTRYVEYWKTSSLTVTASPVSSLQLDGEVMGESPVTFEVLPGALMMKC